MLRLCAAWATYALATLVSLGAPLLACAQKVITTVAGSEIIFPRVARALDAPLDEITCAVTDARGNLYLQRPTGSNLGHDMVAGVT